MVLGQTYSEWSLAASRAVGLSTIDSRRFSDFMNESRCDWSDLLSEVAVRDTALPASVDIDLRCFLEDREHLCTEETS